MSEELVERLRELASEDIRAIGREPHLFDARDAELWAVEMERAADLIERQSNIIKEMREAFEKWECPRPVNGRPDDFTIGQCLDAGECGCAAQVCRVTPEEGE